jgi:hypothetical protein
MVEAGAPNRVSVIVRHLVVTVSNGIVELVREGSLEVPPSCRKTLSEIKTENESQERKRDELLMLC